MRSWNRNTHLNLLTCSHELLRPEFDTWPVHIAEYRLNMDPQLGVSLPLNAPSVESSIAARFVLFMQTTKSWGVDVSPCVCLKTRWSGFEHNHSAVQSLPSHLMCWDVWQRSDRCTQRNNMSHKHTFTPCAGHFKAARREAAEAFRPFPGSASSKAFSLWWIQDGVISRFFLHSQDPLNVRVPQLYLRTDNVKVQHSLKRKMYVSSAAEL